MGLKTFRHLVLKRQGDPNPAILFEDESWTYDAYVTACCERAALLLSMRGDGPLHVGVLLDNVPEFPIWLGAAAIAGGVLIGINPTRRGAGLARDIQHTDCQLIVTEDAYLPLLEGLDIGIADDRILNVDSHAYRDLIAQHAGAGVPDVEVALDDTLLLLFTSGTSGSPKAVICTQKKLAIVATGTAQMARLAPGSVSYQAMPMFHSNAIFTAFAPCVAAGATSALRRKFSASGFIEDVRKFGATYFNYVGKPLSYILATPERPDDADNTLTFVFGNEGADLDLERFSRRFAVKVVDGYGSTETGAAVSRAKGMPKGALGRATEGTKILDSETGEPCAIAEFDEQGRLTNPEQAIGEIVNTKDRGLFEGYYNNDEANAARMRDGMFWTGDLAYVDADGFFYFAGRDFEWLRVDGENFAAAPVERILDRFPGIVLNAVYAVPDVETGDQVMAALQLPNLSSFDAEAFDRFLEAQSDLGTKWSPRYVRLSTALPTTQTSKVQKKLLRSQRWECDEPVYFRPKKGDPLRPMTKHDVDALRAEFEARGRTSVLI
jgi:fatty-acyl-CoA synthase